MTATANAPRRSIREAQKELTRDRLLEAAHAAFEENGYIYVTIDDIIQRAGAARGTFYLYFDSKLTIFQAVLERLGLREQYRQLVVRRNAIENPTVEALQAWFEEYVDLYVENRIFHRAIHEARTVEPTFSQHMLQWLDEDVALWHPPGFAPDAASEKLRLIALMSYIKAEGIMYLWLVQGIPVDRATITRLLAEQSFGAWQTS